MTDDLALIWDGQLTRVPEGTTLFDVARGRGQDIPTLCHDPRLVPAPSCWLCVVEVKQGETWRTQPSCSTLAQNGMVVRSQSAAIQKTRRWALELLLSDHDADCLAPCTLRCPAGVDVPGYLQAVSEARWEDAVRIIRLTNPLPSVCGRICPHPCELVCSRDGLDEALAINPLKRLATDMAPDVAPPAALPDTGRRVAVVGAGPAGLSAAWFLRTIGHEVVLHDENEEPGGMLRYGIPEHRLPNTVLDRDLKALRELGVAFRGGQRLGEELDLDGLVTDFDAVFLALGAWRSRRMQVPGEELRGVWQGVPLLKAVREGRLTQLSGHVAVIGGGNTAVDAARVALRLGASSVKLLYRRDREAMPAWDHELQMALEEGVELVTLVAPLSVEGSVEVEALRLQRMRLGEPDASGRRRPVPLAADPLWLPVSHVISAIGEQPETEGITLAKEQGLLVDLETLLSSRQGVFAGGDVVTGTTTAVEAIAAGRRAALSIDHFLRTGTPAHPAPPRVSRRSGLGPEDLPHIERGPRAQAPCRDPAERQADFEEAELGLDEDAARLEAARCLSCGCDAFSMCGMRKLMEQTGVEQVRLLGSGHRYVPETLRSGLHLDMNKCIRCARCIRI